VTNLKWLISQFPSGLDMPDTCKPDCVKQYSLPPVSRRRLLFASQPQEPDDRMCPAPDIPDFGPSLANLWYDQSLTLVQSVDPNVGA
jgi:hypothetical protein